MSAKFEDRLAALEARVAELERRESADEPETAQPTGGMVSYQGDVHLHGTVRWEIGYTPDAIMELSVPRVSEVLAALGHPVRLHIVRTLLRGPANAADLLAAVGLGSSGQIYHHLKTLSSANIVEQHGRGDYRIAAKRVVPLLVSMLAAADIAGHLGT
ncbi:MAG: helix-turn-helix domain-containing protein [Rhodococcus sp. (in: high G+C Gram-positive bacteria)]|uniref:ArsR/SmtB family transcription factor n=1 Tax=Rhodococcus sp. TaxID=1831 RepID=UPI002ADBB16E|nr:helix-turn-helix domain-containing protein [Rhodococcus sp. (in: high G+C Gram-positive bacteria)]